MALDSASFCRPFCRPHCSSHHTPLALDRSPSVRFRFRSGALTRLDEKCVARCEGGGKLDEDDAMRVVDESLLDLEGVCPSTELFAAKGRAAALLAPGAAVWDDGFLDEDEMMAVMEEVVGCIGSLTPGSRAKVLGHAKFSYDCERRAAMGDFYSKTSLASMVRTAVAPLGGDIRQLVTSTEMRFDQLLRDAEDGAVDEGVLGAMLDKVLSVVSSLDAHGKRAAVMSCKRNVGWGGTKTRNAAADAQRRAQLQMAKAFHKNQAMMEDLEMSFDDRLEVSEQQSAQQQAMLESLGFHGGRVTAEGLADAVSTQVDLKVEEEVSRKKMELERQMEAMEAKFARKVAHPPYRLPTPPTPPPLRVRALTS